MAAPKGNTYYKLAKNFKNPKKYGSPAALWRKALEYVEWSDKNPLIEHKAFSNGFKVQLPKMRALTIKGFCIYACIDRETWRRYEKDEAFRGICERISDMFTMQKVEGAAADLLNPAIVARLEGLVDRKDVTTNNESLNQGYYEQLKKRRKQSGPATDQKGD